MQEDGTIPPGVDKPELYRVQSSCVILPDGVDGVEATRDFVWRRTEQAPKIEVTQ